MRDRVAHFMVKDVVISEDMKNLFMAKLDQDSPILIKSVKDRYLVARPPALLYNPMYVNIFYDDGPGMKKKLKIITTVAPGPDRFFVELGANDGHLVSPTLPLERLHGWTGLLIEPNAVPFRKMLEMHRNAWLSNLAVCPMSRSGMILLHANPATKGHEGHGHPLYRSPCVPLYTLLKAVDRTTVDYLHLDVGGMELDILKTFPFDKVQIRIISVENDHHEDPGKLRQILEEKNYMFVTIIKDYLMDESIFVHNSMYKFLLKVSKLRRK